MIPLKDLVRCPMGTVQTYMLYEGEESPFLKKLSTYALRAKAVIEHDTWICIRMKDDKVKRMVVCKVIIQGTGLKKKT